MDFPDIKQLKKLADACRKAGIKSFKSPQFEFTLSDELPEPKKQQMLPLTEEKGGFPEPSEEELMFWSVGGIPTEIDTKASES